MERASVHRGGHRARTNKYARSDSDHARKPAAGERSRVWVGGYARRDGTRVEGHYRHVNG